MKTKIKMWRSGPLDDRKLEDSSDEPGNEAVTATDNQEKRA